MRGTGWSRALATSPQALRAAVRALKGQAAGESSGRCPFWRCNPFFVTRRQAAQLQLDVEAAAYILYLSCGKKAICNNLLEQKFNADFKNRLNIPHTILKVQNICDSNFDGNKNPNFKIIPEMVPKFEQVLVSQKLTTAWMLEPSAFNE